MSHEHYFRDVSHLTKIDVYRLLELFGVTCPVAQHVAKKAIAAGQRGHKSTIRDWQDISDSATRKLQMLDEDVQAALGVCDGVNELASNLDHVVLANVDAFNVGWPNEARRQDAAAEDEAFAAIKPYTGAGGVQIRCAGCVAVSCECMP